tara:strand:- start:636 stop:1175 length:540 start_codon:yes stop_codon:yes gene_type:complete
MASFYTQKISSGDKTQVTFDYNDYSSIIFTNTSTTTTTIDLYVTSQLGTDIADTGTNVNNGSGYSATSSSQAIVVDATAATSDAFLNEQVWKSDGTLFGTCTTFTDGTHLTFGGGLIRAMADDDSLYTGTRYYLLKNVKIPKGTSLKLEKDEFNFNNENYNLYIDSNDSAGEIDIITRY